METIYSDLLRAAMDVSQECERNADNRFDKDEWSYLNRECRKELYRVNNAIDHVRARNVASFDHPVKKKKIK